MIEQEPSREGSSGLPALEMQGVSFRYGKGSKSRPINDASWVLRDVDMTVPRAVILGVIGPNGSGKSSLLKLLTRLIQPQEGLIRLFGEELSTLGRPCIARQVAYMPQDVAFDFPFSVMDIVLMGRYPYRHTGPWNLLGWERQEDLAVAEQVMMMTDVTHLTDRVVGTLSAGERQRVMLARALAQRPKVLLLDEPTAHLDLNHQLDVCRILSHAHEQLSMTVVMVSHDINLAVHYCNRILVMKQGCVVSNGSPHGVIQESLLREVYGCDVLVDQNPETGLPRVSLPGRSRPVAVPTRF